MMKRITVLILAVLTTLSLASIVYAEESADMNWGQVAEFVSQTPELKGSFVTLKELPVKFYIPDSFKQAEITKEMADQGIIAYYVYGNNDFEVAVYYYTVLDETIENYTLDDYAAFLKSDYGVETVENGIINGYAAISYQYPDNEELAFVTFATEDNCILEFVFVPVNKEENIAYSSVIIASIMGANDFNGSVNYSV